MARWVGGGGILQPNLLVGEIPEHVIPTAVVVTACFALVFLGALIELSVGAWRRLREGPPPDRGRRLRRRRRKALGTARPDRFPAPAPPSPELESAVRDRLYGSRGRRARKPGG